MDENTIKIIQEKFDALPESIREMIMSSHYEDTLITVGQKNNLNVNQMGILERETTLVMMGLTNPKDFETDIVRELNIEKTKGAQIVAEINEKIFLKIRTLLKLMNTPIGEDPDIEDSEQAEINKHILKDIAPTKIETQKEVGEEIFRNAGIEVVDKEGMVQNLATPEIEAPKENPSSVLPLSREEVNTLPLDKGKDKGVQEEVLNKQDSIIMQKLSGTVQMPKTTTEYSTNSVPVGTTNPAPKIDPYRMPIE